MSSRNIFNQFMNSTDLTSSFLYLANLIGLVIQFPLLERPRPRPFSNLFGMYVLFCLLFYYSKPDMIPSCGIGYTE